MKMTKLHMFLGLFAGVIVFLLGYMAVKKGDFGQALLMLTVGIIVFADSADRVRP